MPVKIVNLHNQQVYTLSLQDININKSLSQKLHMTNQYPKGHILLCSVFSLGVLHNDHSEMVCF